MVKVFITLSFLMLWLSSPAFAWSTGNSDIGITIHGVTWAKFNVAAPGTFAANETDYGHYYQWNRNTGWSYNRKKVVGIRKEGKNMTRWNRSCPSGDSWETINDPCPAGWRIPEKEEFESLKQYTDFQAQVRNYNGVSILGYVFRKDGQFLFFPASGYREKDNGSLIGLNESGHYWSRTGDSDGESASFLLLDYYVYAKKRDTRTAARTIRCVKTEN